MKKSIVLSLIGLAACITTAFGQGEVRFESYSTSITTTYGSDQGALAGHGIGTPFTAALVYSLTPISDPASSVGNTSLLSGWSPAYQYPDSSNPANGLLTAAYFLSSDDGNFVAGPGNQGLFILPTYTGSAPVYFEVLAYNGSSYDTSTIRGHSAAWGEPLATGGNTPQSINFATFSVFNNSAVPEPATLAFGGLSLAVLFLFRRQQLWALRI